MTGLLIALTLLSLGCYKIGYQRCRDATEQGVVMANTVLTWQEFLAIAHYKTGTITVRDCAITGQPRSIGSHEDLTRFLKSWGWYAKDFRVQGNTFFPEGYDTE